MSSNEVQGLVSAALYLRSRVLTAQAISARIGLVPTRVQQQGEVPTGSTIWQEDGSILNLRPPRSPFHYFILEVKRIVDNPTDDSAAKQLEPLLDELLTQVESASDRIAQLGEQVSANLICSYSHRNTVDWLGLSADILRRVVALNFPLMICLLPTQERET